MGFEVIFYRREEFADTTPKTTPKTDEKIIVLIKQNPGITKEKLAEILGITLDGIKYHIKRLNKSGVIRWKGSSKGGHWEVVE